MKTRPNSVVGDTEDHSLAHEWSRDTQAPERGTELICLVRWESGVEAEAGAEAGADAGADAVGGVRLAGHTAERGEKWHLAETWVAYRKRYHQC